MRFNNLLPWSRVITIVCLLSITLSTQSLSQSRVICGFNVRTGMEANAFYAKYSRSPGVGSSLQDGVEMVAMIRKLIELGKWPLATTKSQSEGYVNPSIFLTAGGENVVVYEWLRTSTMRNVTILADDIWLKEKIRPTNTRWARTVVFAHELGHIYLGHVYGQGANTKWQREYDADVFTGYMMYHLGASLSAAQSIFKVIAEVRSDGEEEDPDDHPSLWYRLEAVKKGWIDAGGKEEADDSSPIGAGNVVVCNASSHPVTFEVENQRYNLERGIHLKDMVTVPITAETAILYLWECPPSGCRWSEFRIAVGNSYRIINSGYGQGLRLTK